MKTKLTAGRFHMCATKQYMVRAVEAGKLDILKGRWTKKSALAALAADPRDVIVIGDCDNQGPDGSCYGHPFSAKKTA